MKTVVIVGGTRIAALNRLKKIAPDNGIVSKDWYDEAIIDGHRVMAIGGEPEDICYLANAGFDGVEIVTVGASISEAMLRRIRHVRSTQAKSIPKEKP